MIPGPGRIIEELVDQSRCRRNFADRKGRLGQALERRRERLHMGDLPGHQELQCVLTACVIAEINEALINDLRARFRRDIAA